MDAQTLLEKVRVFSETHQAGRDCSALRAELEAVGLGFNPDDGDIDFDYATEQGKRLVLEALSAKAK